MIKKIKHKFQRLKFHLSVLFIHLKLEWYWLTSGRRYRSRAMNGSHVAVSLTSYPPRFPTLHLTLKSLLSQSFAPERIILWIAEGDIHLLPQAVTSLTRFGLEIQPCPDYKSYKKLIPLLMQTEQYSAVIADDDVYYWRDWLKQLVESRTPGLQEVICHRMHRIKLGANGLPLPYQEWDMLLNATDAHRLNFPTGVGGVLYPKGILGPQVLDIESFTKYCPRGDDIWFWWMARGNGAKFKRAASSQAIHCWTGTQECALWENNIHGNFNDVQIAAMVEAYGFTKG